MWYCGMSCCGFGGVELQNNEAAELDNVCQLSGKLFEETSAILGSFFICHSDFSAVVRLECIGKETSGHVDGDKTSMVERLFPLVFNAGLCGDIVAMLAWASFVALIRILQLHMSASNSMRVSFVLIFFVEYCTVSIKEMKLISEL